MKRPQGGDGALGRGLLEHVQDVIIPGASAWDAVKKHPRHEGLEAIEDETLMSILPSILKDETSERLTSCTVGQVRTQYAYLPERTVAEARLHAVYPREGMKQELWLEVKPSNKPGAGDGVFVRDGVAFAPDDVVAIMHVDTKREYTTPPYDGTSVFKIAKDRWVATLSRAELEKRSNKVGCGSLINTSRPGGEGTQRQPYRLDITNELTRSTGVGRGECQIQEHRLEDDDCVGRGNEGYQWWGGAVCRI